MDVQYLISLLILKDIVVNPFTTPNFVAPVETCKGRLYVKHEPAPRH